MRIALVQVGHGGYKPTVHGLAQVNLRSVGILDRRQLVARLLETGSCRITRSLRFLQPVGQVEPVLRRHVLRPGMLETRVIENHVHHHLQSLRMSLIAESAIVLVRAESWVNTIVVRRGIAVIGGVAAFVVRRVVLQHGCQPQRRHAQFVEIIQMFANAVQVATVS